MRERASKFLPFILAVVALLVISACSSVGSSDTAVNPEGNEPTPIPTPTAPAPTPTQEPDPTPEPVEEDPTPTPEPEVAAEEEPEPPGLPVHLRIDKIGVDASFEYVGVTPEGNMDVPQGWENVAWYEPGTIPGDQGNSVITGHYDAPGGVPAIFYNLGELVPGDRITVYTEHDEELVFEITEVETVHVDEAPLKKIFGSTDGYNLNLITCEGIWDSSRGMYDQRLVVYSTLISG